MVATTSAAASADSDFDSDDEDLQPHDQPLNIERIKSAQQTDRFCRQMTRHLSSARQSMPADEMEAVKVLTAAPFFIVQDGLLYRLDRPRSFKQDKMTRVNLTGDIQRLLFIPEGIKGQIVRLVHDELGHAGEDRTYQAVRARF